MRLRYLLFLLWISAGGAQVPSPAQESSMRMTYPAMGLPPSLLPWLPNGATENYTQQMAITAAMQSTNRWDSSILITAFKGDQLVGWRDNIPRDDVPRLFVTPWDEANHVSTPGELWWGRAGDIQMLIGQESTTRLERRYPNTAKLFLDNKQTYRMIGATHASFTRGNGGRGKIDPGAVSDARLELSTTPYLHGTLTFTVSADGSARLITIHVMSNFKHGDIDLLHWEYRYRLRAAASVNGSDCRCEDRPNATAPSSSVMCEFPDSPSEHYELYGAFFGDHAALCGVFYQLELNVPNRNRHNAQVEGVIVLKAESARD